MKTLLLVRAWLYQADRESWPTVGIPREVLRELLRLAQIGADQSKAA